MIAAAAVVVAEGVEDLKYEFFCCLEKYHFTELKEN